MKKADIFWQTYLNLEKEAIELSKYIYFTDEIQVNSNGTIVTQPIKSQLEVFSPYIADLLVRCCVQIEAIAKEIYYDNGGAKIRGESIYFDEDCLKLIDIKWQTHKKNVIVTAPFFNLTKEENYILKPLKEAHKRQGTYWERAYQAVKHDRYLSLQKGNVKAFIQALAALYLLNLYYRQDSWTTNYQDISKLDYSLGSSIFSVTPPKADMLWYGNKVLIGDSPYVISYSEEGYEQIKKMQEDDEKAINDYWGSQPEINESDFQKQLQEARKRAEKNPGNKVMEIWELAKYRLNKRIPNNLTFEERKKLLINSAEWNGLIYKNNNRIKEEEITTSNIQQEIDKAGECFGIEIIRRYQRMDWIQIAMNSNICKIYIP